jgi:hypothetical protein
LGVYIPDKEAGIELPNIIDVSFAFQMILEESRIASFSISPRLENR